MTPEEFTEGWSRASPFFAEALLKAGDLWNLDEVRNEVIEGRAHFWSNATAFAVTNFVFSPRIKSLNYWLLGGEIEGLQILHPHIVAWGIENDCLVFTGEGRAGFKRYFPEYEANGVLYIKDYRKGAQ